jgi:RecA-family ATPase
MRPRREPVPPSQPVPGQPDAAPPAVRRSWTAAELMAERFPDPCWAVPGLLAEGVVLLAGPPKIGKSWLTLGLAESIASGGKALGSIQVEPGAVLYLALEDTARRLQARLGKLLAGRAAPEALTLVTTCPPFTQGGDELVTDWLDRHPSARMVVIDVFAKMRGPAPPGVSAYDADYAAIGRVKRIADAYGVAIVLVHHVRKLASEDFLAEVSGTNGLAGAADSILVLKRPRGTADGLLHITGRDVDEAEHALAFQPAAGAWRLLEGPALDHVVGDTRAAVLRYVREHPRMRPKDISTALDLDDGLIRRTCARMAEAGQLTKDGTGRYAVAEDVGQP